MRCPNCGVTPAAGAVECAGCGVIFAKLKKQLELPPTPSASGLNPWTGRVIAGVILVIWCLAFGWYYRGLVSGMRVRNPAGPARAPRTR